MKNPQINDIWIEAEQWAEGQWDLEDDNSDIIVTLENGEKWIASFFTYRNIQTLREKNKASGECMGGAYLWSSDMILVDELSRVRIEAVVNDLIEEGKFENVFDRIETET